MSTKKILQKERHIYDALAHYLSMIGKDMPTKTLTGEGEIHGLPWIITKDSNIIITLNSVHPYKVKIQIRNGDELAQSLLDLLLEIDDYNFKSKFIERVWFAFDIEGNEDGINVSFNLKRQECVIRFTIKKFRDV